MSTCFTDVDNASLFDCMAKCQASKTETEAKCNGEKGEEKNVFNDSNIFVKPTVKNAINLLNVFQIRLVANVSARKDSLEMVRFALILMNANLVTIFYVMKTRIAPTPLDRTSVPVKLAMKAMARVAGLPTIVS